MLLSGIVMGCLGRDLSVSEPRASSQEPIDPLPPLAAVTNREIGLDYIRWKLRSNT